MVEIIIYLNYFKLYFLFLFFSFSFSQLWPFVVNILGNCFVAYLALTPFLSSAHKFSKGLRSALYDGHSKNLALLSLSHFATTLDLYTG